MRRNICVYGTFTTANEDLRATNDTLAAARDAKQSLLFDAISQTLSQYANSFRLVALWLVLTLQLKLRHSHSI